LCSLLLQFRVYALELFKLLLLHVVFAFAEGGLFLEVSDGLLAVAEDFS
jgi:hypothetical protein